MLFSELTTFLNKYTDAPTRNGLKKFIPKDAIVANIEDDNSINSVESWISSGEAEIATEIAEKLISGKGYAILQVNSRQVNLHWLAGNKFVKIDDVKLFSEHISAKNYTLAFNMVSNTKDVEQTEMMLKQDLADYTEDGTWFDSDDDWSYTHWSQLFNDFDYNDGYEGEADNITAWLIQLEDLEFAIMNWSQTAINVLLAYINTKV